MKDSLYLLKPGFKNAGVGPLYCNDSAPVEGMLSFCPELREMLEIHYLPFPKPRDLLVEALGEAHQSLPVLILSPKRHLAADVPEPSTANGRQFFADERRIRDYLSAQYHLPYAS